MKALAYGLSGVTIGLFVPTLWLERDDPVAIVIIAVWLTAIAATGGLVAARLPSNSVGWLMSAASLSLSLNLLVTAYAEYSIEVAPGSLPFGIVAGWLSLWTSTPAAPFFVGALLVFPNGRLLSRRWKPLIPVLALASLLTAVGFAAKPGPIDNVPSVENPWTYPLGRALYGITDGPLSMVIGLVAISAIISLFLRLRRSRGAERQQLKWFVYAVAAFPVMFLAAMASDAILDARVGPGDHFVDFLLIMLGALLIPLAMGISILRYRLYDIDLIVNRALVYGALTAILALSYLGSVVLLQSLLAPLTADSDVAVAASTLAVAAAFRPLRRRVQAFIDRRFYRHKYDVTETLGAFAARLRDQVDLESLSRELVGVVGTTMQPAHASLWLKVGTSR